MSDQEALTPRVFIVRHGEFHQPLSMQDSTFSRSTLLTKDGAHIGETEWAKSGRFTGITDIELTEAGIAQVSSAARMLVGADKLLDPNRLARVYVSPRVRAVKTFEILLPDPDVVTGKVSYTEDIAEWNYGDYEGLTASEISRLRKKRGLDHAREWDIWTDGCEGGEYATFLSHNTEILSLIIIRSVQQATERLDSLISQIKDLQRPYMRGEKPVDVLLV